MYLQLQISMQIWFTVADLNADLNLHVLRIFVSFAQFYFFFNFLKKMFKNNIFVTPDLNADLVHSCRYQCRFVIADLDLQFSLLH